MGKGATGAERLRSAGLNLTTLGGNTTVTNVRLGSVVAKNGIVPGDTILAVTVPADHPSRYWFTLPAFALLAVIVLLQLRRRKSAPIAIPRSEEHTSELQSLMRI